jgi:hypothetical protein
VTAAKRTGLPAITDVGPVIRNDAPAGAALTGWTGGGSTGSGVRAGDDDGALAGAVGAAVAAGVAEGPLATDVAGAPTGLVLAAGAAAWAVPSAPSAANAASWIVTARAIQPPGRDVRFGFTVTVRLDR